jgi:hypothetical protein
MNTRFALAALVGTTALLAALPLDATAQTFAAVALDDKARRAQLDNEVATNLRNVGIGVVVGEELVEKLESRQSDEPDPELLGRFAGLTTSIGSGVNEYFYAGNERAVELLAPAFDLGVNNRDVLARRPDYAEQVYSAGVVLVRAYRDADKDSSADAVVNILARHFPSKSASAATVPPDVIKLIVAAKKKVAEDEAFLEFEGIGEGNCTTYLNGFPVTGRVAVVPDLTYFARHDCGRERTPTWEIRAGRGEVRVVPIMSGPYTEFELASSSVRDRARAERLMQAIAFWTDLDGVVGASTRGVDDQELVVGRWMPSGVTWSDGISSANLQAALSRVFPELDGELGSASPAGADAGVSESEASGDGPGALPWLALGGGSIAAAGGVVLFLAANTLDAELECSVDTASTGRDCSGVEAKRFTPGEIDDATSRVNLQRIGAYTAWGLGAVAIGWGIYALVTHDSGEQPTATFGVSPTRGGAAATLDIRF